MLGKKIVISDSLLYCHPLLLRQKKNNQNQTNKESGKRYFNDILWAPAYNNNTLPDTGISSNKI
jgi:hypothetical protein